jgi:hypothetical protein
LSSLQNWAKELFFAPDFPDKNYATLCQKTCDTLASLREEIAKPAPHVHFAPRRSLDEVGNDLKLLINYYENYGPWGRFWKRNEIKSCRYLTRNPVFHGKSISDLPTAHATLSEVEALQNEWGEYEKKLGKRSEMLEGLVKSWGSIWESHGLPGECTVEEIEKANESLRLALKKGDMPSLFQPLSQFGVSCNFYEIDAVGELHGKLEIASKLIELRQLEEIAKGMFPKTLESMKSNPRLCGDIDRAFEWKCAQMHMAEYLKETDGEAIQREIKRLQMEEKKLRKICVHPWHGNFAWITSMAKNPAIYAYSAKLKSQRAGNK